LIRYFRMRYSSQWLRRTPIDYFAKEELKFFEDFDKVQRLQIRESTKTPGYRGFLGLG
jgi:hypothetical protein